MLLTEKKFTRQIKYFIGQFLSIFFRSITFFNRNNELKNLKNKRAIFQTSAIIG